MPLAVGSIVGSGARAAARRRILLGRKSHESLPLIYDLAGEGWTCLSGDYQLSRTPAEGHPGHLVDVKRLIAWVRTQGETWGVAPATIVLVGTSAGAHLSAMAALTANQPAYQPGFEDADTSVDGFVGLAGYYGPVSGVDGDGTSPFDHLAGAGTPALIVHGTHDVVASPDAAARLAGTWPGPVAATSRWRCCREPTTPSTSSTRSASGRCGSASRGSALPSRSLTHPGRSLVPEGLPLRCGGSVRVTCSGGGAMTRINLVHDAMHRSIGQTRAARDRLAEDRRTAGTSVHSLLTGGWQGVAADAFAEAWTEWLEAADRVAEGLESMASLLEAHQRDMARQDDSTQRALDAVSARIIDRLG